MNKTSSRLGINFLILSGGETISKVLTFAAFAYLARLLGPENFGIIEFALSVLFVFTQLVDFGTEKYGAVETARGTKLQILTTHILFVRILFSVISIVLLILFVAVAGKSPQITKVILIYGLSLMATPGLLIWVFQGHNQMQWVSIFSIVRQFVFTLLVFLWIRNADQLLWIAFFEFVAISTVVIFNVVMFRKKWGRLFSKFRFDEAVRILHEAAPIFMSQMMTAVKLQFPAILLGFYLATNTDIGFFRASHRIVFALNTFVMLYFFNLLPSIAHYFKSDKNQLSELVRQSLQFSSWGSIFIAILVTVLAPFLIVSVYGADYLPAARALQIMIWLIAAYLIGSHYRFILIGSGNQKLDLNSTALGAGLTLIFCTILIPSYGFLGAAAAMIIGELATWGLAYYYVRREVLPVSIYKHLVRPLLLVSLIIIVSLSVSTIGPLLKGGLLLLVYPAGMWLLQPTLISDLMAFLNMESRG